MRITASPVFIIIGFVIVFTTVSADMCQDLCFRELGRAGCSKGSWCKNNKDCQSLFWTSALKTAICVFDGTAACSNKYPVLCHEAAARLGGAPATTTTTPKPMAAAVATTTTTARPTATTTSTSARSPPNLPRQVEAVELSLHYTPQEFDVRPRVKVSFLAHGQDIGFSLVFDTGSHKTHILRASGTQEEVAALADAPPSYLPQDDVDSAHEPVSRPAKWMEGYLDVGFVAKTGGARVLQYGTDDKVRDIPIHSCITEVAVLFSGSQHFSFPIEIDLSTKMDNRYTGIGLLGAGRTSPFAELSGAFAYIGPMADYSGWAMTSAGRVLIGERDSWDMFCGHNGRVKFFPTQPRISSVHWAVRGSITAEGPGGVVNAATPFIIDTGAATSFVTSNVLEHIRAQLIAGGAQLVEAQTNERYAKYTNCPLSRHLPVVTFKLGDGPSALHVTLLPIDYIARGLNGECTLVLSDSPAGQARLIGMNILSKMMTVFDRRNDRLGFCITRS